MAIDWTEFKSGLSRTGPYLLSHHELSELYRCHTIDVFGKQVHICARCSGIYPGILLGLIAYFDAPSEFTHIVLVGMLPLPAMVEWMVTFVIDHRGYNILRTITGVLLGYGYGLGLALLVMEANFFVLLIGFGYGIGTTILLSLDVDDG